MHPILFLDFDGVLVTGKSMDEHSKGRLPSQFDYGTSSHLCYILYAVPECRIVVSSSWRHGRSLLDLQAILCKAFVPMEKVIDKTPSSGVPGTDWTRGVEIQAWLYTHPEVTQFAILDDDNDMGPLAYKLVQTDWEHGLTFKKACEVVNILNGK